MLSYTDAGFAVASDANEGVPVTAKAQPAVRGLKIGFVDKLITAGSGSQKICSDETNVVELSVVYNRVYKLG